MTAGGHAVRAAVVGRRARAQLDYRQALAKTQLAQLERLSARIQAFNEVLDLLDGTHPGTAHRAMVHPVAPDPDPSSQGTREEPTESGSET